MSIKGLTGYVPRLCRIHAQVIKKLTNENIRVTMTTRLFYLRNPHPWSPGLPNCVYLIDVYGGDLLLKCEVYSLDTPSFYNVRLVCSLEGTTAHPPETSNSH